MSEVLIVVAAVVVALPIWYLAWRLAHRLYAPWVLSGIDWSGPLTFPPPPPPSLSEQFHQLGTTLGTLVALYEEATTSMARGFNEAAHGQESDDGE